LTKFRFIARECILPESTTSPGFLFASKSNKARAAQPAGTSYIVGWCEVRNRSQAALS
jgi:hypothetical protein